MRSGLTWASHRTPHRNFSGSQKVVKFIRDLHLKPAFIYSKSSQVRFISKWNSKLPHSNKFFCAFALCNNLFEYGRPFRICPRLERKEMWFYLQP